MLCLRTRYFTSFCQRMLLYEVTTFLKHRRSWNWGCRRHKSWICCTWGRHLRNDRGKQNCRSLVVADHERKSQTSKQEDTVSMWSNLHHFLKKWQQYLTLQKVLVIMTVHPVYLFEDKTIWRLYKTMLCFAFAALHIALLPNHWRSFPIKSYQVISWTRTGGSPCQMRRFGQVITTTTGPNLNDQGYQRRTKEEPSKDQEMKSKISGQHTVSTIPLKPISPYVLMNVLMADSKLQQNMISRSGPGRNLPNGEWHCEPCMSYQFPARCILSISEYLFSLPNISMANQKLQNRHFGKVSRTNTKLAKSMKKHVPSSRCWSKYGLIFFPSSEEHWRNSKFPSEIRICKIPSLRPWTQGCDVLMIPSIASSETCLKLRWSLVNIIKIND